ncbi:PRC-barrel domain-containing protein [Pseudorhodoplanes sp.]|uniref:PRC-barrel domain-containing protein n=1 Tax=Pseudorhodoplanes sp. TaxID=1934341 RepID=UPI003D099C56
MRNPNQLVAGTAFATLITLSPAIAESPGATNKAPPAKMDRGAAPSTTAPTTDHSTANVGNLRASALIGTSVRNAQNQSIGDINDLLLASDGTIDGAVVGVGGFLGLGERNVVLRFDALSVSQDGKNLRVTTSMTKQQLQTLPEWKSAESAR